MTLRGERMVTRLSAWIVLTVMFFGASGCIDEKKVDVARTIHPEKMPTMRSINVSTLISDSGVTQYKIVTPEWLVFDEIDTPCWRFPKGVYLRKYDRKFKVIASVAADSATYFTQIRVWRLDGNVEMTKAPNDLFQTQQLFWDERNHKIHTDSFMHVETETHVLEGLGFISNQDLTDYSILSPTGIFPIDRNDFKQDQ